MGKTFMAELDKVTAEPNEQSWLLVGAMLPLGVSDALNAENESYEPKSSYVEIEDFGAIDPRLELVEFKVDLEAADTMDKLYAVMSEYDCTEDMFLLAEQREEQIRKREALIGAGTLKPAPVEGSKEWDFQREAHMETKFWPKKEVTVVPKPQFVPVVIRTKNGALVRVESEKSFNRFIQEGAKLWQKKQ